MSLHVCPTCRRHVREDACPFCGAPQEEARSRGAAPWLVLGAAAVAAACRSTAEVYGGPPMRTPLAHDADVTAPAIATADAGTSAPRPTRNNPPASPGDKPSR